MELCRLKWHKQVMDVLLEGGKAGFAGRHCGNSVERPLLQLACKKLIADQVAEAPSLRNLVAFGMFGMMACTRPEKKHGSLFLDGVHKSGCNVNHGALFSGRAEKALLRGTKG